LQDPIPRVRRNSAWALGQCEEKAKPAQPALIKTLDDPDPEVRAYAAWALSWLGSDVAAKSIPPLKKALTDSAAVVRINAALSLTRLGYGHQELVPVFIDVLKVPNEDTRKDAIEALVEIGKTDASVYADIGRAINDPSNPEAARRNLILALRFAQGRIGPVVPALIQAAQDPSKGIRSDAIEILGRCGRDAAPAVPILLAALRDPSKRVRKDAFHTLTSLGDKVGGDWSALRQQLLHDESEEVRARAVSLVGARDGGLDQAVADLIQAMKDPSITVRYCAAGRLGEIGRKSESAVSALVAALRDPSLHVRMKAAEALGKIGADRKTTIDALLKAMKDELGMVRVEAIGSLALLDAKESTVIGAIKKAEKERDPRVQKAARLALKKLAP
jgi:HEAT repeat protein